MKNYSFLLFAIILCFMASCKPGVSTATLTGKWKYVKVEHPNASPPDSMRPDELAEASPYIQFTPEMKWNIVWGGKYLSHGSFTLNGNNIKVNEKLPDGKTRDFVFTVTELTETNIVFETIGADGSKVTAVRMSKF
ncbi:MAG: hypothetical protein AAGC65_01440 [Mucilaginibacter sp.]|uniref:hypothetical protein n=1 Tax=Mucilaginibacter sp. TaxID=1882438 RepID=UPI0031AA50A2